MLLLAEIACLLSEVELRTSEARIFGYENGGRVEVWENDILCCLDLRRLFLSLLDGVVGLAAYFDCSLVLFGSGEVVEPELPLVLEKVKDSKFFAFFVDPASFCGALVLGVDSHGLSDLVLFFYVPDSLQRWCVWACIYSCDGCFLSFLAD
ncbi:hypothetical protein [Pseudomonas fluorescens]|uniref:hypothetical protein n=1 Tax=Pseudomonas fluorescens TaxID=294 RepID=UPI00128C1D0C|nr:hypothetical protein [Pseudomonas fluorescens]